jgi:hypothetical protein
MNDEKAELFKKIASDTLATPDTWEVALSASTDKKATWEGLIERGALGYMALLRNLRNLLQAEISNKHLKAVCAQLTDAKEVENSKQLPFRFLSAYKELEGVVSGSTSMILDALEEAMLLSSKNIKGFDEETSVAIACDVSGSMETAISPKSSVQNYDIGLVLGMLLHNRCKNVLTGIFGDTVKFVNLPKKAILANVSKLHEMEGQVGYSTNGYLVLDELTKNKQVVDKVMIFTDCQMWNSFGDGSTFSNSWRQYKTVSPNAKLYLFDLAGYGSVPLSMKGKDVFLIAGWSEKIFTMLDALERGSDVLAEINAIQL